MIEVNNLSIKVQNKILVDNISFKLYENERLGIIGSSGSGKSLTVLSIMGLLDKSVYDISGSIKFNGSEILNLKEKEIAQKRLSEISIVYQNPFNTFSPVEKISKQIDRIYKIKKIKRNDKKIAEFLNEISLDESYLNKYPNELSGGELQRLVIMTSLLLDPRVLICDEPTTSLDIDTGFKIIELLNKLKIEQNLSLIFVTHDLSIIKDITDNLIIMKDGKIIEREKTMEILENPKEEYTKKLLEFSRLGE